MSLSRECNRILSLYLIAYTEMIGRCLLFYIASHPLLTGLAVGVPSLKIHYVMSLKGMSLYIMAKFRKVTKKKEI